jgi:hypothetical protein
MKALIVLSDAHARDAATRALRAQGCTEFVYKAEDAQGIYHYAVIQVFSSDEERLCYKVDESHPLMVDLKMFVDEHPNCYVLAVTHEPCENDGRTAFLQGADWWIIEASLSLPSNWEHARKSHHMKKGVPSWEREVATANV